MKHPYLFSVVIAMYNEEVNVQLCYDKIRSVLNSLPEYNYEIIFVNDGSTDNSWNIMETIALADKNFKPINLSRNFGQQAATHSGLLHCLGDYAFIMDGDLQHPPDLFPQMIDKCIQENYDSAHVMLYPSKDKSLIKQVLAECFYTIFNFLSSVKIPRNTSDFRIINRKMIDTYLSMPEKYKFIRGQFSWMGFKQCSLAIKLPKRALGSSKFTLKKSLEMAMGGLFSFSFAPIRLISIVSLLLLIILILMTTYSFSVYILISKNLFIETYGFIIFFLLLTWIIVSSIAILGEYILHIHTQVLDRPVVVISNKINY